MKNLKSYLKERVKELYDDGIDFWDLNYELFGVPGYSVENWPEVECEGDMEELDMENFEWLSISDDELVIACGGDWQEPLTLSIHLEDDNLVVVDTKEGFAEGLTEDEFNDLLGL